MGCFSCLKGKRRGRDVREKGAALTYTNPQHLNESPHDPAPIADRETTKRAVSSAEELDANERYSASHREKAEGRAPSPARELQSKPITPGESLPSTPHKKSVSPDPEIPNSPPFVDSGIGSTPVTSRSTSSKLLISTISTVYDSPPTPTPSRSYISTGSSPLASPIALSLPRAALTHTRPEEHAAGPSVPDVPPPRSADAEYPTSSFAKVNLEPEPKVRNPPNFNDPALESVAPHIPTLTPELESAPEVPKTQTHSRRSSPPSSPPFLTASQTPQPQVYTFGSETAHQFTHQAPPSQQFTAWAAPQDTEASHSFSPTAQPTQGARPTQSFNSGTQSSQSYTSATQPTQSTWPPQSFSPSTQSSQSTQFSQYSNFNSPPPLYAQPEQSAWSPQGAWPPQNAWPPQPFATNPVDPFYPHGLPRGTFCRCGAENEFGITRRYDNYNRDRPFRRCPECPPKYAFNGFTDERGLSGTGNPNCNCVPPTPMRLTLNNGQNAQGQKTAFYSCQYKLCGKTCDFTSSNKLFEHPEILQWVAMGWL